MARTTARLSTYKVVIVEGQDHVSPKEFVDFAENWGAATREVHPNHKMVHDGVYAIRAWVIDNLEGLDAPAGPRLEDRTWPTDGPSRPTTNW